MSDKPSVLFVCVHNAGRSQMAAAYLEALGGGKVEVRSAGSAPGNAVNPAAVEAMAEEGIDMSAAQPKILTDEALLAFNKPAGIAVQPLSSDERGTLMNGAVARFPELAALGDQPLMAGALHRIDTETSGLVLAARTAQADKYAPYEWTSANLYIHKAREEVGYSDFEQAVDFAQKAAKFATQARDAAMKAVRRDDVGTTVPVEAKP